MQIHQVVVSGSPGDAVTNSAFEMRALLRHLGPSEIYARYYDERLAAEVRPIDRFGSHPGADPRHDVIIYHASIGEPAVLTFLAGRAERVVLVYHNITPAEYFAEHHPAFATLLAEGRRELALLRDRVCLALADSPFNAGELEALGYRDVRVSPLIVDLGGLTATAPDVGAANHLSTQVEGPLVLFVGQLLPHKRPDLLVQAYHVLVTHLVPEAKLALVGPARLVRYRGAIQSLIEELNLAGAWVAGAVPAAELVAYYRRADVFATMTEHEGFCVPLLEAMGFDVPVVARGCAAVPDTLDGAGILLPPEPDPLLAAEAMAEAIESAPTREILVQRGRERLGEFNPDRARRSFLENLEPVL